MLRHEEPSPKSLDLDENCPCYFLWKSFSATSSSCSCLSLICQKNQLIPISRLITSVSNSVLPYDVIRGMPEWMVDWTKVMDGNVQLAPLPLLKRTQTWPYANSQTQNISGMALNLPLKQNEQQSEKKTRTKPDIDCYQPAVPYRRLCAYKTWHHLQCHLRPPWSGHCERIKKVLWVDQPIWLFCRIVNKLRNMLTVGLSHPRALDVAFWWENKSSYWFGAASGN